MQIKLTKAVKGKSSPASTLQRAGSGASRYGKQRRSSPWSCVVEHKVDSTGISTVKRKQASTVAEPTRGSEDKGVWLSGVVHWITQKGWYRELPLVP
jgi:hypothetical protein